MRLLTSLTAAFLALTQACAGLNVDRRSNLAVQPDQTKRDLLQNIVTWDADSLLIRGKRLMIFSGEFHPFRLPVPSLWLDIFQKVKALGLNTVSFYMDWALLEGKPGDFSAKGIFDLETFFAAATEAGLYLIARPGPYINAEASGGGFPGWLQRLPDHLRTADPGFLAATDNYVSNIASIIAKAQITNGGPVILYQPENEYTNSGKGVKFPDPNYMQYVEDQARKAGIVVPLMSNDASPYGNNAPGTGRGEADIYGHDGYPLGFDCSNPTKWPSDALPTNWRETHLNQSANTPYSIPEFQAGSFDPWGGASFEQCEKLLNHEQTRVFYKNNYAAGVSILNVYMAFGGTNWGNLGHPGGYTSYDYAAFISEERMVDREKYSELKLQAQFLKVSPGYLTAEPALSNQTGVYSPNTAITVSRSAGGAKGSFYFVRHTEYHSTATTPYTLKLETSAGNLTVPALGGTLTLSRRDSKIHVVDYPVGDAKLIYSTAEIFTWRKFADKTVLVVYGGPEELHELAVAGVTANATAAGDTQIEQDGGKTTIQWMSTPSRRIFKLGNLHLYALDRNSAYNYWVPELSPSEAVIVNGGYLVRSAAVDGDRLSLKADFNTTTTLEIIGAPAAAKKLVINGVETEFIMNADGNWAADAGFTKPDVKLPDLAHLAWYSIDSLPEIKRGYDDSAWPAADHTTTNNTYVQPLLTPVSLYGSDYSFNTGVLLFRGYFTASGSESELSISTQGGSAFGSSVWLNETFIGSWAGNSDYDNHNDTYALPDLTAGQTYVFTVLVDNMGFDENWRIGSDLMKAPRGISDYRLSSGSNNNPTTPISWKITGNLGGEDYVDRARGPLNEGGLFIERQGYHQAAPPLDRFTAGVSPTENTLAAPGVTYYTAKLTLDIPADNYDIPLSFVFTNGTSDDYRAWLYVNGFQYGRYISQIGPQSEFPVPEGILNHKGDNWIGLAVWATGKNGTTVSGFELLAKTTVATGREEVVLVEAPAWKEREGAY